MGYGHCSFQHVSSHTEAQSRSTLWVADMTDMVQSLGWAASAAAELQAAVLAQPGSGEMPLLGTIAECERCWDVKAMAVGPCEPPSPSAPLPGCLTPKDVIHGDTVIKGIVKYLTFSPPSSNKKSFGFHVLQAVAHTLCVPQSKGTTRGVLLEKRNNWVVLGMMWDKKENNSTQHLILVEAILRPGSCWQPKKYQAWCWSNSAIFPASW